MFLLWHRKDVLSYVIGERPSPIYISYRRFKILCLFFVNFLRLSHFLNISGISWRGNCFSTNQRLGTPRGSWKA